MPITYSNSDTNSSNPYPTQSSSSTATTSSYYGDSDDYSLPCDARHPPPPPPPRLHYLKSKKSQSQSQEHIYESVEEIKVKLRRVKVTEERPASAASASAAQNRRSVQLGRIRVDKNVVGGGFSGWWRNRARPKSYHYLSNDDLSAVRRLMSSESSHVGTSRDVSINVSAAARGRAGAGIADSTADQSLADICPSCCMSFDKGKKRRLVDTCGHQRCYACMFRSQECPVCTGQAYSAGSSPAKLQKSVSGHRLQGGLGGGLGGLGDLGPPGSPALSTASGMSSVSHQSRFIGGNILSRSRTQSPSLHGPINGQGGTTTTAAAATTRLNQGMVSSTPASGRRRFLQSPKLYRSPWLQQRRRVQQLSVEGEAGDGGSNFLGSHPKHHFKQLQTGTTNQAATTSSSGTNEQSSHSRESGFQSSTSLTSLGQHTSSNDTPSESSPAGTLGLSDQEGPGTTVPSGPTGDCSQSRLSADSLASLISGLSDSASNQLGSRRHSLATLKQQSDDGVTSSSRKSMVRRSARLPPQVSLRANQTQLQQSGQDMAGNENVAIPQLRQLYWTLKPLFFEVPTSEPTPTTFVGRQWLYREISEHLTSDLPTNRGVIIAGAPGTGKTAVVLQMVEYSCFGRGGEEGIDPPNGNQSDGVDSIYGHSQMSLALSNSQPPQPNSLKVLSSQIVAYHFCQADNAPTCLVPEFVHSLAAQLSQAPQLTPYYQLINSDPNIQNLLSLPGCVADPTAAFLNGILEPLHALRRLGRLASQTCIVVIDGLCDAEIHRPDHGHTLATFLSKHLTDFPDWLKIICTVKTSLQDCTKSLPFQKVSLDKTDVDERLNKDMTDYILLRISRSPSIQTNITPTSVKIEGSPEARIAQFLVQVARGCFLYVKMTLDLIERGHLVIKSSSFNVLPLSLSEIFLLEFNLKFPTLKSFEKVQDILSTALASLVPLTPAELFTSINALDTEASVQWGEFLIRFSVLSGFLLRRADDTVMFFHPTFREWLIRRRDFESKKFICDPRMGHAAIAFRMCRSEAPLNPDRTLELGHHILKAHVYKNHNVDDMDVPPRDLQAMWVAMTTEDVSIALGAVRNVSNPNVKVSRLLLLAGASPDHISDYLNNAPLVSVFSSQGYLDMVSLLIEFGADVNSVNSGGVTALMFAAKQGNLDIVRLLIQHGAIINLIDKCEMGALVFAAKAGHLNTISYLVSCDWVTDAINDLSLAEAAQQAMVVSAEKGHEQVLEFLLDLSEVNIDRSDTLTGNTALCAAASAGQKRCVEILLRRGGNLSLTNLKESPPLHMAIGGGHWDVTELLLKEGAGQEQADSLGRTPLMIAAMEGHTGVLELLISKQSLIEALDNDGLNTLGWACLKGRVQAVSCLLDQCADLNHVDKSGRTPLDLAAYKGDPEIVQLLLDRGAVMEHVDKNGMRPLDQAISAGHAQAVQCFLKKGAKLGPATWALANNKQEILMTLLNKLLEDGNTLYRKSKYEDAAHRYQYALRRVPSPASASASEAAANSLNPSSYEQLRLHLLLNLSRCRRKLGDYAEAAKRASEALALRPDSLEALHARARALREDEKYEDALADLSEAVRLSPQNRELHKLIIRVKEEYRHSLENNNNNNEDVHNPVGAGQKFRFLDDASSVATDKGL